MATVGGAWRPPGPSAEAGADIASAPVNKIPVVKLAAVDLWKLIMIFLPDDLLL